MSEREKFLTEINDYMAKHNVAPSTFGWHACGDYNFVKRVLGGRRLYEETIAKVRDWMRAHKKGLPKRDSRG